MIEGGISTIPQRYAKDNSPYSPNYDVNKVISFILQLDSNNLQITLAQ